MRTIWIALLLLAGMVLAAPGSAQTTGPGQGGEASAQPGPSQEQARALYELRNDYVSRMPPVSGKLQGQYAELYARLYAKDPAPAAVKKNEAAITDLQGQLLELCVEYARKAYDITGWPMGPMGCGMMGSGMGPGMMMSPGYGRP